jgi:outer membrane lipoprotein
MIFKKFLIFVAVLIFSSCAPVLHQDYMKSGIFNANLSEIKQNPSLNQGQLFIFGGVIARTTATKEGSIIEGIYVPVNSRGYLKNLYGGNGRFLAIYRGREFLDPLIFSEKREITLAAEFLGTRNGKIGELDYIFPFFEIKEVYLWEEIRHRDYYYYYYPPQPFYYPSYYYRNRYYSPWWYY